MRVSKQFETVWETISRKLYKCCNNARVDKWGCYIEDKNKIKAVALNMFLFITSVWELLDLTVYTAIDVFYCANRRVSCPRSVRVWTGLVYPSWRARRERSITLWSATVYTLFLPDPLVPAHPWFIRTQTARYCSDHHVRVRSYTAVSFRLLLL